MHKRLSTTVAALALVASSALAQSAYTGKVVDKNGEPVIGASVKIDGTKMGAVTNADGEFTLTSVPKGNQKITISYIGMKPQTVTLKQNLTVEMAEDGEDLDEVVVQVAYGAAKKSTLTGAVTQVDAKSIEVRPVSSATAALEGTTSGVQVNSTYGQPGDAPSIYIRGIGSVNGSTAPLYVLDGVPFGGNISDVNPNDIESVTVLKDAASAALYGNRASNGVILITTKRGKGEKISFDFSAKFGTYNRGIKEYATTNPRQFMEASWQNLRNARISAGDDAATAANYASKNLISEHLYLNIWNKADDALFTSDGKLVSDAQILSGFAEDLDWEDAAIRNGKRQEYNFSGMQATSKSDMYFSVGYLNEEGYATNSGFNRLSGRARANFRPKNWFHTGFTLAASHQKTDNTSNNGDSNSAYVNAFYYTRNIAPIYPVYLHNADGSYALDANGNKQYDIGDDRNQFQNRHTIWENELNENRTYRNTIESSAYADFLLPYGFQLTVKGEVNLRNSENRTYRNAIIGDGNGAHGTTSRTIYRYKNWTAQEQLSWHHTYGVHSIDALVGHENYKYQYDYTYNNKSDQVFAGKDHLSNFNTLTSLEGYDGNYRTESYLGRVRYNYDDRYNLEVSFRRDGSSRFAKDTRWGNFGSIGANWMISKEKFMENVDWVNSLKLRADWGTVGNDASAGYYAYKALYEADKNGGQGAYYLTQIANDALKWETSSSWGIGVDARLFNRWNISVEYYDKRNKDLIFDVYNPLSAGATSSSSAVSTITMNLGTMKNTGWEFNTDVDIFKNKDWRINLSTNGTFMHNEVTKLPEQNRKEGIISGVYKIMEGKSRYEFYTYHFAGVDQMTGKSLYDANLDDYNFTLADGTVVGNTGTTSTGANAQAVTAKDAADAGLTEINGKYYVHNTTYGKRDFRGSAVPKFQGAFTPTILWKDLTVSAIFTYSLGGKVYDAVYANLMSVGSTPGNLHEDIMKSWTETPTGMTEESANRLKADGTPRINYNDQYNNAASDRWLISRNYFVVKNINLSYALPRQWVRSLDLDQIRINASIENLATFTKRQGMNPQQTLGGYQYNQLVTPRVFSVGVNVKF